MKTVKVLVSQTQTCECVRPISLSVIVHMYCRAKCAATEHNHQQNIKGDRGVSTNTVQLPCNVGHNLKVNLNQVNKKEQHLFYI